MNYFRKKLVLTADISKLESLFNSENVSVREDIARNKNTPIYLLQVLSKDKEKSVIFEVVLNSNCTGNILDEIYSDNKDDLMIIRVISFHKNCSNVTLKKIYLEFPGFRDIIIKNPNWNLGDFQ